MYKRILVPVDLADPNLAKPALDTAVMIASASGGDIRLINVLPVTPVMLAEYVPADFDVQQRKSAEDALAIIAKEVGLGAGRVSVGGAAGRHLSRDSGGGEGSSRPTSS